MSPISDYGRVFNRLSHMAALSRDGQTTAAIENLLLTVLAVDEELRPTSLTQISEAIEVYFGVQISKDRLQKALDKHCETGSVTHRASVYVIEPQRRVDILAGISAARDLEASVRQEWLASVEGTLSDPEAGWDEELWNCLREYMAQAFQRHGLQTIRLLDPSTELTAEELKSLTSFLRTAYEKTCNCVTLPQASNAIHSFFSQDIPQRTRYITQLLDGTFTFFALTIDDIISDFLRGELKPISIFLDTNFIFGVLDLHSSPLNEVSRELVALIEELEIPFSLLYHTRTLKEFEGTVAYYGSKLKGRVWKQSISRAVTSNGWLSGIEQRFHELNADSPLNPDVFLSQYEQAPTLLTDYGFEVFSPPTLSEEDKHELYELIADYRDFVEEHYPYKDKRYEGIDHDMRLWQTVQKLQTPARTILDTGALLLTADNSLYAFDAYRLTLNRTLGVTVMPNQLLQVLRPFLPNTANFDRQFVETFALPEFTGAAGDYSSTRSKVASYLNVYERMPERTAARIIANDMLLEELQKVPEDSDEFKDLVDNAIIAENERLQDELSEAKQQAQVAIERASTVVTASAATIEKYQQKQPQIASKARTDERNIWEPQVKVLGSQLKAAQAQIALLRWFIGILFGVIGIVAVLTLPGLTSWDWFLNHPRKTALTLSALTVIAGISWAIIDKKHRTTAIVVVVLGAGVTGLLNAV